MTLVVAGRVCGQHPGLGAPAITAAQRRLGVVTANPAFYGLCHLTPADWFEVVGLPEP